MPLHVAKSSSPTVFACLHPSVFGVQTHFVHERIVPCMARNGRCQLCDEGWRPRWRGYIGGVELLRHGRYLFQCTAEAWLRCADLQRQDGDLGGTWWTVHRAADHKQARMVWTKSNRTRSKVGTEPFSIVDVLSNLWGLDLARLLCLPDFVGDVSTLLRPYRSKGM